MSDTGRSSPSIDFKGPWSKREMEQVAVAVSEVNGLLPERMWTVPWVASCHRSTAGDMFAVSQAGLPQVLAAQEAGALAKKIRALDVEQVRSAAVKASSTGRSDP